MSETKTVWHKYPEELPPGDGHYLITAHDYGDTIEHPWIDIDFFDKDAGRFLLLDWDGTDKGWCVTAWAELPEPPHPYPLRPPSVMCASVGCCRAVDHRAQFTTRRRPKRV